MLAAAFTISCAVTPLRANLVFDFVAEDGTSAEAIAGFRAAGQLWSEVLTDDITIRLQIGFEQLPFGVIGQTSNNYYGFGVPTFEDLKDALAAHTTSIDDQLAYANLPDGPEYSRLINHTSNNPNGPNSATPYTDSFDWVGLTLANARVLGFVGAPTEGTFDGRIVFSSLYSFDFSHETIEPNQLDFVGAAAHEIGHLLGFVSGVDDIDSAGGQSPGTDFSSNMIDLFRYSEASMAAATGLTDYTADMRDKYFSVDGGVTSIASFATGVTYGDGNQASHWKDNRNIGIMDPTATEGEKLTITNTDVRLFDVLGYTVVPEPCGAALLVVGAVVLGVRQRRPARAR